MVCAEWRYVRNGGMYGMAYVEWDKWNGRNGMAEMEAGGWECLVYRIVYSSHP